MHLLKKKECAGGRAGDWDQSKAPSARNLFGHAWTWTICFCVCWHVMTCPSYPMASLEPIREFKPNLSNTRVIHLVSKMFQIYVVPCLSTKQHTIHESKLVKFERKSQVCTGPREHFWLFSCTQSPGRNGRAQGFKTQTTHIKTWSPWGYYAFTGLKIWDVKGAWVRKFIYNTLACTPQYIMDIWYVANLIRKIMIRE